MPAKLGIKNRRHVSIAATITLINLLYHFHYFLSTDVTNTSTLVNDKRSVSSNQTSVICPPIRPKNSFEVPTPFNLNKYKPKIVDYSAIPVCERPWKNNRVFVLETRREYLMPKAFCTLESLAIHMGNNWCVTMLMLNLDQRKNPDQLLKLTRTHLNLKILKIDPDSVVKGGPFDGIFKSAQFHQAAQKDLQDIHYSEILKVALLYNYGGIFVDLDTIALKSLDLAPEFLVRNANGHISNSLMKFKRWSFMLLRYVSNIWTDYSPENFAKMDFILSGVVEDHCKHMLKDVKGKKNVYSFTGLTTSGCLIQNKKRHH